MPVVDRNFLLKYDVRAPRYTSYPPATHFSADYTCDMHREQLIDSNVRGDKNISLYVHIPFCPVRCLYCGCNQEDLQGRDFVSVYVDTILLEIERVAAYIDRDRKVTQVHWGGGTPNSIHPDFIEKIMLKLREQFSFPQPGSKEEEIEIAMEIDPSIISLEKLERFRQLGFNRVSFGVQDFNLQVLEIVNRRPSKIPIPELVAACRKMGYRGINLDFIYGLPGQKLENFAETIDLAIASDPDRIVTFSYAHVPWVKNHQSDLEKYVIPSADEKLEMFLMSLHKISHAGYAVIGMDHYAKFDDELSRARENGKLHRNFQGYASRETTGQVYAFGCSSISQLEYSYAQNVKTSREYVARMNESEFAIEKGIVLTEQNYRDRAIITELMCNGKIDVNHIASITGSTREQILNYFSELVPQLQSYVDDHLLKIDLPDKIEVTKDGWLAVRSIATHFDPLLKNDSSRYSKAL